MAATYNEKYCGLLLIKPLAVTYRVAEPFYLRLRIDQGEMYTPYEGQYYGPPQLEANPVRGQEDFGFGPSQGAQTQRRQDDFGFGPSQRAQAQRRQDDFGFGPSQGPQAQRRQDNFGFGSTPEAQAQRRQDGGGYDGPARAVDADRRQDDQTLKETTILDAVLGSGDHIIF